MDRIPHVIFTLLGAVLGMSLAGPLGALLSALLAAAVGYLIAEVARLATRLRDVESTVEDLQRRELESPRAGSALTPSHQPAPSYQPAPTREATPPREPTAVTPPGPRTSPAAPETHARPVPAPPPVGRPPSPAAPPRRPEYLETSASSAPLRADPFAGWLSRLFAGGNFWVRAGVVVLLFGVGFLIRYVAEHTHVPIELRLSAVALAGLALVVLGWRLRGRRSAYALALQGGGIGVLYLTVFAALHPYALLSALPTFALLVLIAVGSSLLALAQDAPWLAALGALGGFLAPVLCATGADDHVTLFSYYLVLNAGIALIAWFKAWRGLNLLGLCFTYGIGAAWGVFQYQPHDFPTAEPFLIAFFLLYVGIAVLFSWRQPLELRGVVDPTLVFGNPLLAFSLQAGMLLERPHTLALSAVGLSALYFALAALIGRRHDRSQRLLIESCVALGTVFATLAVPLRLGSRWNACAWALEGAALVWLGCRLERILARCVGVVLIAAAAYLALRDLELVRGQLYLPPAAYLAFLLVSASALASAALLARRAPSPSESWPAEILATLGLAWWFIGALAELPNVVPDADVSHAFLTFFALSSLGAAFAPPTVRLRVLFLHSLSILLAMLVYALFDVGRIAHPLEALGWLAWPAGFLCFYLTLYRQERLIAEQHAALLHVVALWLLTALLGWESAWLVAEHIRGSAAWPVVAWGLVPASVLALLPWSLARIRWPMQRHASAMMQGAGGGLCLYLTLWELWTSVAVPGDVAPLAYAPLANPIDLVQLFVLWALARQGRLLARHSAPALEPIVRPLTATLAFAWLNAALLRALHAWAGVPWSLSGVLHSRLAETSLSICWALVAIFAMLLAARRVDRALWTGGATLLGIVIAKLFLVDLASVGSIERIVSFVGVGLLMLIVGYFSPIPPRPADRRP